MQVLNRELLSMISDNNKNYLHPVKILQYGEGNFLRAFVDYMIDKLNSANLLNGSIVIVQPIENGLVDMLKQQDYLYTLMLRGLENGEELCEKRIITSISQAINPYKEFEAYISQAYNPELKFVVSNTTESGIVYNPDDRLCLQPQSSFPAKVVAFLYERFKYFKGDINKGLVFIPCELIDNNGTELKRLVLKIANEWNLEEEFLGWIEKGNIFTNTLVDRIVTGYPKNEIEKLTEEFGYRDNLINTCEIFHFWVIEGPQQLRDELPFDKLGLNVVWTDDATPYKMRKVRILNGAHTCSVLAAYLSGKNTVGEMINDHLFKNYLKKILFDEIIPTLDLPYEDLVSFTNSVFDRFANPYIEHYLLSISLNSVSKFKTRVLPSILEYNKRKNEIPRLLAFSFASLIAFYKGDEIKDNALIGHREEKEYKIIDNLTVLEYFRDIWTDFDGTEEKTKIIIDHVCSNIDFWGVDLSSIDGFSYLTSQYLFSILNNDVEKTIKELL